MLLTHGGHPGAAGVSLLPENIAAFRRELSRQIEHYRDPALQPGLQIDVEAPLSELSLELEAELARLAPFGQGNPTPRFATFNLTVVNDRRMGNDGAHRKLRLCLAARTHPCTSLSGLAAAMSNCPPTPRWILSTRSASTNIAAHARCN
ncbi:MAG: hypothetical protein IPM07_20520 [Anaerolineales bacterium]|nr:hypothetical protein [Anaerolineales bacterium]